MKWHRFIGDFDIKLGTLKIKDEKLINQFRNVLKLRVGERVILCDGNMNEATAEIKEYGKNIVEVYILKVSKNKIEPERHVVLYCSILKKENFELVIQKTTEAGIKEIMPIITERTIKLDIRKDRLGKIIKEAAEQSGRGIVPVLHDPIDFKDALNSLGNKSTNFIFDLSGQSFDSALNTDPLLLTTSSVWIGPEGGWHTDEIKYVLSLPRELNFYLVSLGKLTLRAETAAIIGSYLAIHSY